MFFSPKTFFQIKVCLAKKKIYIVSQIALFVNNKNKTKKVDEQKAELIKLNDVS